MQSYKVFKSQIIAGTKEDSQGERYTYEFFADLVSALPDRLPLNQQHDMRLETVGHIENIRLVPHEDDEGEWNVIADVYTTSPEIGRTLRGFSFSKTIDVWGNTASPLRFIHLPYPLYQDQELIQSLIDDDSDLCVGKWIKKSADPLTIGLLATAIALLLAPEWEIQYKKRIRPAMKKLLDNAKKMLKPGASVDLVQHVVGHKNENIKIYFIPERGAEIICFDEKHILKALEEVKEVIDKDSKGKDIGFDLIKLYFDKILDKYVIFQIQYKDGSDLYVA